MISVLLWIAMQGVPTGIFLRIKPEPRPCVSSTNPTHQLLCHSREASGCAVPGKLSQPPEPMDVPAVKVPADSVFVWHGDIGKCNNGGHLKEGAVLTGCVGGKRWSCADKSRILLTSEDGVRHCVKF